MGHQVGLAFTPYAVVASSEYPEHPATHLLRYRQPRRGWWAEDTASILTLQQPAADPVVALYIADTNFAALTLRTSADGAAWSAYGGGTLTIPVDDDQRGRRHGLILLTGVSSPYLELTPTTHDAGAVESRVGVLALVPALTTLPRNFNAPIDWQAEDPVTRIPYANRGFELHRDGQAPHHVSTLLGTWPRQYLSSLRAIEAVGIGNPWLLVETIGAATRSWIVTQTEPAAKSEVDHLHQAFRLPIEEFA